MSSYLNFKFYCKSASGKTDIYNVLNTKDEYLGQIKWNGAWRKYCFYPNENTLWDIKCLSDVCNFINKITNDGKTI